MENIAQTMKLISYKQKNSLHKTSSSSFGTLNWRPCMVRSVMRVNIFNHISCVMYRIRRLFYTIRCVCVCVTHVVHKLIFRCIKIVTCLLF